MWEKTPLLLLLFFFFNLKKSFWIIGSLLFKSLSHDCVKVVFALFCLSCYNQYVVNRLLPFYSYVS